MLLSLHQSLPHTPLQRKPSPVDVETQPDARWNQPEQPQTLAHFQSIGSTEVELPHTRRTCALRNPARAASAVLDVPFAASHLRGSVICFLCRRSHVRRVFVEHLQPSPANCTTSCVFPKSTNAEGKHPRRVSIEH